jgi:hypothetical protein
MVNSIPSSPLPGDRRRLVSGVPTGPKSPRSGAAEVYEPGGWEINGRLVVILLSLKYLKDIETVEAVDIGITPARVS